MGPVDLDFHPRVHRNPLSTSVADCLRKVFNDLQTTGLPDSWCFDLGGGVILIVTPCNYNIELFLKSNFLGRVNKISPAITP